MADGVLLNEGTGGDTVAADDISGTKYQIIKLTYGALDSQTIASSGNGTVDAGCPRVTIASDTTGVLSVDDNGANLSTDWAGTVPPIGAGTEAAALRVTLATDSTGVITVDNGGTFATQATLQSGTAEVGKLAAGTAEIGNVKNAGTFAVQSTLDAETTKVIGSTICAAAATGGMSFSLLPMAAEDNDTVIKASAATLYFISVQSIDATPVFLKLFNATSITAGTTNCDMQFMCPAAATAANAAGIVLNFSPGIQFGTGLVALTATGIAIDDNTAVSANEVVVNIGWE